MDQNTSFWTRFKSRFSVSSNLSQQQQIELIHENDVLKKRYYDKNYENITPPPSTDVFSRNISDYPEVRMPRIPYNLLLLYEMRYASVVLRTVCIKIKWEIFRATAKNGWVYKPKFKVQCTQCNQMFKEEVEYCEKCGSLELKVPDLDQQLYFDEWSKRVNPAEQSLIKVMEQTEDDLNTADDGYMVLQKKYFKTSETMVYGKVVSVMRGDPTLMRIVCDHAGNRGGKYYICVFDRGYVTTEPGYCPNCDTALLDVHYVETESGGTNPLKYYAEGEVIHFSKYDPSATYGVSPIYTVWTLARTLNLMDSYVQKVYEKGRLKGILGVNTDDPEGVKEWWADTQQKLRNDPHYLPLVGISSGEGGKGKMEFIKLIDSLKDMEYGPAKELMKQQISGLYGVSPIFQADFSSGSGLNNEGLQITVTDRAVEFGQSIYHNEMFPILTKQLGITDWDIQLQPSEENDEMAGLQLLDQAVTTAQKMQQMGFEVEYVNEEFVFSEQPQQMPTFDSFSQFPNSSNPPQLPSGPQPANTQGTKHCPPGMVSTIENPRCHPIEWDTKQKALDECQVFQMIRTNDETGVSGTGNVATGIIYPDQQTVLRWNSETPSVTLFNSFDEFKKVHVDSHPGNETQLQYYDMTMEEKKELMKSFQLNHKKKDYDLEENHLLVNCRENTFQQELKEAQMPNYKLFWTMNKVKLVGNTNNARNIYFKTKLGVRGFFKILGYGSENYRGKNQEVVYFNREFSPLSNNSLEKQQQKEPGRKIRQARQQIENRFLQTLIETTNNELFHPLELLGTVENQDQFRADIDQLLITLEREIEKTAFAELIRSYLEGKKINVEKATQLPRHLNFADLPISQSDMDVIRAIYTTNPFWQSFKNFSQSLSDQLKQVITDSYIAPSETVFREEFARVQAQHVGRSLEAQLNITYGRIGKLDLRKIIKKMQQEVQQNFNRLETIARTETTAVTNKGREIAFETQETARDTEFLFDWHGPNDFRTTEICKTIKRIVQKEGQGAGVSMERLKEIHIEVVNRMNPNWDNGTVDNIRWVPHANCRHVLRRTGEIK